MCAQNTSKRTGKFLSIIYKKLQKSMKLKLIKPFEKWFLIFSDLDEKYIVEKRIAFGGFFHPDTIKIIRVFIMFDYDNYQDSQPNIAILQLGLYISYNQIVLQVRGFPKYFLKKQKHSHKFQIFISQNQHTISRMMVLFKWEAKILNSLYKTRAFEQIILPHSNLSQINYQNLYKVFHKLSQVNTTYSQLKDTHQVNYTNYDNQANYTNQVNYTPSTNNFSALKKYPLSNPKTHSTQHFHNKKFTRIRPEKLIATVNTLCHPNIKATIVRDQILKLDQLFKQADKNNQVSQLETVQTQGRTSKAKGRHLNQNEKQFGWEQICLKHEQRKSKYQIEDVIIYSALSKCRIWPKMLKCSLAIIPHLIEFYNRFTKDFEDQLDYKFDPVILSPKFEKAMNKIQQKKQSFPQLFFAIQKGNCPLIQLLLEERIGKRITRQSVTVQGEQNLQLERKGKFAEKEAKKMGLEMRELLNSYKKDNQYVAHYAVMYGGMEVVKLLHKNYDIDFEAVDNQQQTPIFYAVKRNHFDMLKYLVEEVGVNINHKEYQNRTPIYLAAFEGNLKMVNYLYLMGADPEMQSKLSRTPLSKACYLGNVSVAEYLIKIGVKLTTVDSKSRTALHNAAWGIEGGKEGKKKGSIKLEDSPECVQLLLDAGHPVDFEDTDGFTPLFSAAASMAIRSMRILIERGANLKHKTKRNQSLAFIAAKYGHLQSLSILIEQFCCDYLEESQYGVCALDVALAHQQEEVGWYLLDLYYKQKLVLSFSSIARCLSFYKKAENLRHIQKWAENNIEKCRYLLQQLQRELEQQLGLRKIIFEETSNLVRPFVNLIESTFFPLMSKDAVNVIFQELVHFYVQGSYEDFPQFLLRNQQFLFCYHQLRLENLAISPHSSQSQVIKLLTQDSNLTDSPESLKQTILYLIKRRFSKVILWILKNHQQHQQKISAEEETFQNMLQQPNKNKDKLYPSFQNDLFIGAKQGQPPLRGVHRYTKEQIEQILKKENPDDLSVWNYCYAHGLYDAVKLMQTLFEPGNCKVQIPEYSYSFNMENHHQPSIVLSPVKDELFDFRFLMEEFLKPDEANFYRDCFKFYGKKISELKTKISNIDTLQQLQLLKKHMAASNLIGFDVEHYSNDEQQFICLLQLSSKGQTFLIDPLTIDRFAIEDFLNDLLANQDKIKIFHSYDQDLRWLTEDFAFRNPFASVIDTSRIHSIFFPKIKSPSLKKLVEKQLGMTINKDFQRSDWRIRPLFEEMKVYAATDALVLPFIFLKQLMDVGNCIASENQADREFFLAVRKQFGSKRYVKSKGRTNHFIAINAKNNTQKGKELQSVKYRKQILESV